MEHNIYIKYYLFVKLKESRHFKGTARHFKGAPHHFKVNLITLK